MLRAETKQVLISWSASHLNLTDFFLSRQAKSLTVLEVFRDWQEKKEAAGIKKCTNYDVRITICRA